MMRNRLSIILGKLVKKIAKFRGGGSALPGLFVEKINPGFVRDTLSQLPHGIVIISGTNGKTTTTKMVVKIFEEQGLKVFTNRSGSNFVRGVVAAMLDETNFSGKINADIAVLELDEAHAIHFIELIPPQYSLLLNVMRDQLDRFGEIDFTAQLLRKIGESTTREVVLNAGDSNLSSADFSENISAKISTFAASRKLQKMFMNDEDLHNDEKNCSENLVSANVILSDFSGQKADIFWDKKSHKINLKISGIYNILNAAAAVTLTKSVFANEKLELNEAQLVNSLENIKPAFGRGEMIEINDVKVELVLVKNPGGFRLGLTSFSPENFSTMIAINDNYADGRDMSWLWDVDFSSLRKNGVNAISGIRAYDMALRLFYEEVPFDENSVETDLAQSLAKFLKADNKPKRIFCTYTAMLKIREELAKITDVEKIS